MSQALSELADPCSLEVSGTTSGAVVGRADLAGVRTAVFATMPEQRGGALAGEDSRLVADAVTRAAQDRVPVVGLWHSGGARVDQGVGALDGMGTMFRALTLASGKVPQVSVVLGPCAGGAAYGPALTDVVIAAPDSRLFVTGPGVIRDVTGEQVTPDDLGGPGVHSTLSGLVHVAAPSRQDAVRSAREVVHLLGAGAAEGCGTTQDPWFETALPARRRRAYDVHPLVARLLDPGSQVELHRSWAPNLVTVLGRLGGRVVGVIANNPLRLGGCLDGKASDKAARFVRTCDSLGLPLVLVVDTPGYLPGVRQEHDAIVRRGAKLLHAYAEATVPRITLITRKSYGGAYIAMGSRALGADAVLAWPSAEVDVMGAEAAVGVLHRRALAEAPEDARQQLRDRLVAEASAVDTLAAAVRAGVVDRVIAPRDTRTALAGVLSSLPTTRGRHGNIPL